MNPQLPLQFSNAELESDWAEYLFLIPPHERVTQRIIRIKEKARILCNEKGVFSPPHLTVAKIKIRRGLEPRILSLLQEICSRHHKFAVEFKDFGSFESVNSTCTIYIKVKEPQPFLKLAADLRAAKDVLKLFGCKIEFLVNNPHLSLVRGLPRLNYKAAMPVYNNRVFRDPFLANEIVLSKRWDTKGGYNKVAMQLS